jgi:IclR family acetate operon transcriptional repressor
MAVVKESGETGRIAGTQAISRAFAVLHLFRDHVGEPGGDRAGELGVGAVARELGLTLSTAHRMIRALVAEGYLAQSPRSERYYLGTAAFLLGQAAQRNLGLEAVRPVLEKLGADTGESVNLGMLDGGHAVIVQRVESSQPLRFSQSPGTRLTLYATSMGKVFLAFNTDLGAYLADLGPKLDRLTPKTHGSARSLRGDLNTIRERGWSTDDEESILGVRCVGAPVLDAEGKARAAIAVQAPAVRMPDARYDELGPLVVAAADAIAPLLPAGHAI